MRSRTYHISGCDRFTRWYFDELGIDVGENEEAQSQHRCFVSHEAIDPETSFDAHHSKPKCHDAQAQFGPMTFRAFSLQVLDDDWQKSYKLRMGSPIRQSEIF